jgi:hypothetical protein
MKILFITHTYPNYVPDLLLHGLRKLFGNQVIDYPRKNCVYQGVLGLGICPDDQRCPGWFPADDTTYDRDDIWRKVERGHFNLVICDIRALPLLTDHLKQWPKQCVLIDGEDKPSRLPPGPYIIGRRETDGSDYSIPIPMAIPEELFGWIARYDNLPKRFSVDSLAAHTMVRVVKWWKLLPRASPTRYFRPLRSPIKKSRCPQAAWGVTDTTRPCNNVKWC